MSMIATSTDSSELSFAVGEVGTVRSRFTLKGAATKPDIIKLFVKPPNAAVYEVPRDDIIDAEDVGWHFEADIEFTDHGTWQWRWEGRGGVRAIASGSTWVSEPSF